MAAVPKDGAWEVAATPKLGAAAGAAPTGAAEVPKENPEDGVLAAAGRLKAVDAGAAAPPKLNPPPKPLVAEGVPKVGLAAPAPKPKEGAACFGASPPPN